MNVGLFTGPTLRGDLDEVRAGMDVNVWGTLSVIRALAPIPAANDGGVNLDVASIASQSA